MEAYRECQIAYYPYKEVKDQIVEEAERVKIYYQALEDADKTEFVSLQKWIESAHNTLSYDQRESQPNYARGGNWEANNE